MGNKRKDYISWDEYFMGVVVGGGKTKRFAGVKGF